MREKLMFVTLPQSKWIDTNIVDTTDVYILNPCTATPKHMPHHEALVLNICILNILYVENLILKFVLTNFTIIPTSYKLS